VASLHVHPSEPGKSLVPVERIELVEEKGIREDSRYFNRKSRTTGQPSKRQVTLIEREQIEEHSNELGITHIEPGVVRSNVETTGIYLQELVGLEVEIGEARVLITEARTPCQKMDLIHPGLRARMENARQGVLAQVVRSGMVRVGDRIRKLPKA
jgi:MOSC domain-containing protein YiiM